MYPGYVAPQETHPIIIIFIIINIKKDWQCKAGRECLIPCQSEDPSPTISTHIKKEEKGKAVADKKGGVDQPIKKHWPCSWHCDKCDIVHRRPAVALFLLCKIRCNPMRSLYGALPLLYMSVRVTLGTLVAHRYTYVPPHCRTSQYRRSFIDLSVYLWNDLADPVFDGMRLAGFKSRANVFLLA